MLTFVVRRLLLALPVLLGVVFVVMLTIDLLPGDAVTLMLGEHATKDAVAALREHLGLDKPFVVRYLDYVGHLLRGDLGRSMQQNRPVAAELADAWPATLQLTVAALVIAAAVGIAAGVVSAVWPCSTSCGKTTSGRRGPRAWARSGSWASTRSAMRSSPSSRCSACSRDSSWAAPSSRRRSSHGRGSAGSWSRPSLPATTSCCKAR